MTLEEISALPVGALVFAEGLFYLVYDRRENPKTNRPFPLVTVVDWEEELPVDRMRVVADYDAPLLPGQRLTVDVFAVQRLAMDVFVPDFEKGRRIA